MSGLEHRVLGEHGSLPSTFHGIRFTERPPSVPSSSHHIERRTARRASLRPGARSRRPARRDQGWVMCPAVRANR
eukprot:2063463-Prymnesium_polylepis.2